MSSVTFTLRGDDIALKQVNNNIYNTSGMQPSGVRGLAIHLHWHDQTVGHLLLFFSFCSHIVPHVVVVGAGVIGLSVATHISEHFKGRIRVTVVAEQTSPNTCSDKAGSVIIPIDFASDSPTPGQDERVRRWTRETFRYLHALYQSEAASEIELCLMTGYDYRRSPCPDPWWKDLVLGFRCVDPDSTEAHLLHFSPTYRTIWAFTTYMLDCRKYLPWLLKRFKENGGKCEMRKVGNLRELSSYNVVINCTGMGARTLLGDKSLIPVRGQGVLVRAPWVKHFIINYTDRDEITYVLPRAENILLGGTAEAESWDQTPDPETARKIRQRCEAQIPSLKDAEVIDGWAGLRPVRESVRLEVDQPGGVDGPVVLHCYGHGGEGVVLHWGCALEVGRILEQYIRTERENLYPLTPRSNL